MTAHYSTTTNDIDDSKEILREIMEKLGNIEIGVADSDSDVEPVVVEPVVVEDG